MKLWRLINEIYRFSCQTGAPGEPSSSPEAGCSGRAMLQPVGEVGCPSAEAMKQEAIWVRVALLTAVMKAA